MKACLDTSVFIAVKNVETDSQQCERILDAIDDKRIEGDTSSLVIADTLVGFYQNNEDREAEHFLTHATRNYMVLPVDLEAAEKVARIRTEQRIKLPDAIIIATAGPQHKLPNNERRYTEEEGDNRVAESERIR